MAARKTATKSSPTYDVFQSGAALPSTYSDPGLPAGLRSDISNAYNTAANQYNEGSFRARHPIAGPGLDALIGALTLNPINALMFPMLGQGKEARRKSAISEGFQTYAKNALENQKSADAIAQPRNDAMGNQALIDQAKSQGLIPSGMNGIPDLYSRSLPGMDGEAAAPTNVPVYSPGFLDSYRKGAFGGSDLNYFQDASRQNAAQFYGMSSGVTPPAVGGDATPGALTAGVSETNTGQANVPAPFFVSDPGSIMDNLAKVQTDALTQGQNRYEFDQEAPKRAAEVQKLMAEGRVEEARRLLLGAQTTTEKQRPGLIKAQASEASASAALKNRTDPNLRSGGGRAPNVIDLMTPEQRQQYAARTAAGLGAQYNPEQARLEYQLETTMNSDRDAAGNPIPLAAKQAAAATLQRLRANGRGVQTAQPLPGRRPMINGIPIE